MSDAITLQSVFNAAWDHFIVKGNREAAVSSGTCRYVIYTGARCAIGLALSGEQLKELEIADQTAATVSSLLSQHRSWFDETEVRNGVQLSSAYLSYLTSGFASAEEPSQDLRWTNVAFANALTHMQIFLHDKHAVYEPDEHKFVLAPRERSLRYYYETVAKMLKLSIPTTEPNTEPETGTSCNQE